MSYSIPFRALFAVVALALASASAAGEYVHDPTGVRFPEKLAVMPMVNVRDFEGQHPGLGVGISYRLDPAKVDVYLYTLGMPSIPDDVESEPIVDQLEQAVSDVELFTQQGHYQDLERVSGGVITAGERRMIGVKLTYAQDGVDRVSYVLLSSYRDHFVKVRFTYAAEMGEFGEKLLGVLLHEIGALLAD